MRARILISLAFLSLILTLGYSLLSRHDPLAPYAGGRTEFQIYALFFPAFLAVLLRRPSVREKAERLCRPWIVILLFVAAWVVCSHISYLITHVFLVPVCFPIVILSTVFHPESWLGRFLEWSPMRALGRISYSLYLWQQLFFGHSQSGFLERIQSTPWNLICTLIAATLSYLLLEKPMMRLGHRLAPPPTPGHKDLEIKGVQPSL